MWYDINTTLSYNCLFNFIIGPRGVGKTYALKKKVIRNFIERSEHFVYLRRYETEIKDKQMQNFFTDIYEEFPGYELEVKKGVFYCDDSPFGMVIPLSKSIQFKSVPFPKVSYIVFDEFIIDVGMIRYLPNEVNDFLELYSTVARLRDVRTFFLSNAITVTNPYFLYFDVKAPTAKNKIWRKGDILVQYVDNPDYTEAYKNTRFGKLVEGTAYSRYAMENEFLRDTTDFISELPPNMRCRAILSVNNCKFGLYESYKHDCWYISEKYDQTVNYEIALNRGAQGEDTEGVNSENGRIILRAIQSKYNVGLLRFTSVKCKNLIGPYIITLRR